MADELDANWTPLAAAVRNVVRWLEQGADRAPKKPATEAEAPAAVVGETAPRRAGAAQDKVARSTLAEWVSREAKTSDKGCVHGGNVQHDAAESCLSRPNRIAPRELYAPHAGAIGLGVVIALTPWKQRRAWC
jgi:hypothetical protein